MVCEDFMDLQFRLSDLKVCVLKKAGIVTVGYICVILLI